MIYYKGFAERSAAFGRKLILLFPSKIAVSVLDTSKYPFSDLDGFIPLA